MKAKALTISIISLSILASSCTVGQPLPTSLSTQPEPTHTQIPTVVEPGLAYGDPCKPPCWRRIVPGQSTGQETMEAIAQLRTSGWASYIRGGPDGGYYIEPGSILITIKNNDVKKISGQVTFDYSVGDMVEQFGDPEGLYVVSQGSTTQHSCEEWELPTEPMMSSPVHVLYPKQGLWFLVLVPINGLGSICPEMRVTAFTYYSPRSMAEALTDDDLTTSWIALQGVTEQELVKWHGFGPGY